ncbi:MAG: polyphosphate kinase 2 family protein [Gammaproteobacteria bacterium]|nr:polyphosphate kinase 2 family protein [Gammaproteobacteria bacterium]
MFEATASDFLVPFNGSFKLAESATRLDDIPDRKTCKRRLRDLVEEFDDLQHRLYAADKHSVLLVFQAMDAAGKDSTIRAVMSGLNPTGCQVFSFKQPSDGELDHDFLWRTAKSLPQRGRIGVFNRSYYEEVLVVRVHPEYLGGQKLPRKVALDDLWQERFESIRDHEKHLARNGTVILKFWLNVSRNEQRERFLARLDDPAKNWKFSAGDVKESALWKDYMHAYEEALNATSRPWAPWYAIPADDKPYMRLQVAETIVESLKSLNLQFPAVPEKQRDKNAAMRKQLENPYPED